MVSILIHRITEIIEMFPWNMINILIHRITEIIEMFPLPENSLFIAPINPHPSSKSNLPHSLWVNHNQLNTLLGMLVEH